MFHLVVRRFKSDSEATLSRVYLRDPDGKETMLCHGLEDEYRETKVYGETRIPKGTYKITLRREGGFHQRYARKLPGLHDGMIWVRDVPGFEYILIHIGNFETNTHGCLLLGKGDPDAMAVWSSSSTYKRVYAKLLPLIKAGKLDAITYEDHDR